MVRSMIALMLTLSATGCGLIDREYHYTRATPAASRQSPTQFTVRFRLDADSRQVVWMEAARDDEGPIGASSKTYIDCDVIDRGNWRCVGGPARMPGDPFHWVDEVSMEDGTLKQYYW